jgi:sulfate transport system permease protein
MITGKKYDILPGKNINLVFSLSYLSTILILPLGALVLSLHGTSIKEAMEILLAKRSLDAFRLSFMMSFIASVIALLLGIVIAWTLVRYSFPGKNLFDSLIDLPFAMPTAVSGIALATLYSKQGWIGKILDPFGIEISYTSSGILLALIFIGLPFVVRSMQPAIESLDRDMEEAGASLGASRPRVLGKIVFPQLFSSMLTGFTMSFSRCLGEYGSVIFIAGNVPYESEILPLLIVVKLEQFDFQSATVLAVGMLAASFCCLVAFGFVGNFLRERYG